VNVLLSVLANVEFVLACGWIPLLVWGEIEHLRRGVPLSWFAAKRWSTIFPLAMFSLACHTLARSDHLDGLSVASVTFSTLALARRSADETVGAPGAGRLALSVLGRRGCKARLDRQVWNGEANRKQELDMDRASAGSLSVRSSRDRGHCALRGTLGTTEVRELFLAWQRDGDEFAREQLVERYMPLARRLARRYVRSSESFDDLQQVASVGLLHAVDRFDVDRGRQFATFAVPTILGELRRYFRDAGWTLHVPRAAKERALVVRDAVAALRALHGRSPTACQLSEYLEMDLELVLDAMAAMEAYETCSLEAPRPSDDGAGGSYADSLGAEDERFELIEYDATLCTGLAELEPRDRQILRMSYVEELTQSQIADRIGVSQMQVSRLLRRSLDQLRDTLAEVG
jgi:RNA polymerase sigma-B factor